MIQILNNQYPIGWEWIANIPLSQMKFFYDLMATVTDNTDIYSSLQCERMESYPYLITKILCVDRIKLAQFLNDDQYFDYNVDELDMVLYGATIIQEQEKYKPLIMQKFQHYKDNFDEEEHAEEIDYYLNFLEEPETLYTFTENIISLFKSFIK